MTDATASSSTQPRRSAFFRDGSRNAPPADKAVEAQR